MVIRMKPPILEIKVDGYKIVIDRGNYINERKFSVVRELDGKYFEMQNFEYMSDAARYIATQKGIEENFAVGWTEAIIQIYTNMIKA